MRDRDLDEAWRRAGEAVHAGDVAALRQALADRPDLAINGWFSLTLLEDACKLGRVDVVTVLLDAGIGVNAMLNGFGGTALITAAGDGHLEVARLLLARGADPDIAAEEHGSSGGDPDASGRCPLYYALWKQQDALIDLLEPVTSPTMRDRAYEAAALEHDAEFEDALPYPAVTRWLLQIARVGNLEELTWAIEDGADVNVTLRPEESHRTFGSTPLAFVAARGRLDLVEALLQAGADPGLVDHLGRTAADLATANGHTAIATRLRSTPQADGA